MNTITIYHRFFFTGVFLISAILFSAQMPSTGLPGMGPPGQQSPGQQQPMPNQPPVMEPGNMPYPEQTPSPPVAGLDGAWLSADGEGVLISANQWVAYENGQPVDQGFFQIQGSQILAQSAMTGQMVMYQFQVTAEQLLLQLPNGEVYQYFRVQ